MPGIILLDRGIKRPIITCQIAFPQSVPTKTPPGTITVTALVDTGATHVVINPSFLAKLPLPASGTLENTVVGAKTTVCPAYKCDVIFTGRQYQDYSVDFSYRVFDALAIADTLSGYDIILGWDVLNGFDLNFSRSGTMTIHLPD